MKRRRTKADNGARDRKEREAGFSMVELLVVITVFGILVAAALVNWSSFTKYQNLRADAHSFQKEIMAFKARALENNDSIRVTFASNQAYYDWRIGTESNRRVNFTSGTRVLTVAANGCDLGTNVNNAWTTTLRIMPSNLTAFTPGCVVLENDKSQFRIKVEPNNVKPILEYKKNKGATTWTKL